MNRSSPQVLLVRSVESTHAIKADPIAVRSVRQLREKEPEQLDRYLAIRSMRQVAREMRVSRTTVAKVLTAKGIDTSPRMKRGDVEKAVDLYARGNSRGTIRRRLGFDNHTVLNARRSEGVRIRPQTNN